MRALYLDLIKRKVPLAKNTKSSRHDSGLTRKPYRNAWVHWNGKRYAIDFHYAHNLCDTAPIYGAFEPPEMYYFRLVSMRKFVMGLVESTDFAETTIVDASYSV